MLKSLRDYSLRAPTIVDSDGPGAANVNGTPGNDSLTGTDRSDVLNGGAGDDTMAGGLGNDQYFVDSVGDVVIEDAGQGYDTVTTTVTYVLGANLEYLDLIGSANINGTGNAANNVIDGNNGNNILDGGAGADGMYGQAGDDTFMVDNVMDQAQESEVQGNDTVIASVSYTLFIGSFVENLILSGSAHLNGTGNGLDNVITGNTGNNTLSGLDGNDSLDGGAGDDTLYGGEGNDTLYGGATGNDLLSGGGGNDELTGDLGKDTLQGDDGDDHLFGMAGEDVLDGGAGNDTLFGDYANSDQSNPDQDTINGGTGDDTLFSTGASKSVTHGDDGNDWVFGGGDIYGDAGSDTIISFGSEAATTAYGGDGDDYITIKYYVHDGSVKLDGGDGSDHLVGYDGNDVMDGGAGDDALEGGDGNDNLTGGAGNDTYYVDAAGDVVVELEGEGSDVVFATASYVVGAGVEYLELADDAGNIDGTGNADDNRIYGNAGDNVLTGGGGDDVLYGEGNYFGSNYTTSHAGADSLYGGDGNDGLLGGGSAGSIATLNGDAGNDIIHAGAYSRADGGAGIDVLYLDMSDYGADTGLGVSIDLSAVPGGATVNLASGGSIAGFESFDITGTAYDDTLIDTSNGYGRLRGGDGNDRLEGRGGNDWLDGGAGADTLLGGLGDDTFRVDNSADVVTELNGQGRDEVIATASYSLAAAYVEVLTLTGYDHIDGKGNALNNLITGNGGNNRLDGAGGADTLQGWTGDDTYVIDNVGDVVIEDGGNGTDTVLTPFTTFIQQAVENLILTGTGNVNAYGSGGAEHLTGNSGDNLLNGFDGNDVLTGGAGLDTLVGGLGDDTLVVDTVGDVVTELNGQGTDVILSSVSFALSNSLYVETLTLTGPQHINATGNAYANVLNGNSGNNTLNGGSGADTMAGGTGHDIYVVENLGDVVIEGVNAGTDTVQSAVSFVLGDNVENLTLAGSAAINGTGNGLANIIYGNNGANLLIGGGGADKIYGRGGNDTYVVDNTGMGISELLGGVDAGGIDQVLASVSYSLKDYFENLTLTGVANINGVGNGLANSLVGNDGNNNLNGGAGNDTLTGGLGADIFVFGTAAGVDRVTDFSAAQNDRINVHLVAQGVVGGGGISLSQVGGDTVIDLGGGNMVTVVGAVLADVQSHMVW